MSLADILTGLGDIQKGYNTGEKARLQNEQLKTRMALEALSMQKYQQQQQGEGLAAKFARNYDPGQIPQPPMAPLGGGAPDQLMGGGGGGMPQPAPLGGGMASGLPAPAGGPLMTPNLAGSGVNWQGENPLFKQNVSNLLQAAPPDVRDAASVDSGFRTNQQQAEIYDRSGQGTKFMAAPPGKSLHEQGLAADWEFKTPEASTWVHQNAKQFGLDFPLGDRDPNHMQLAAAVMQKMPKMESAGVPAPVVKASSQLALDAGTNIPTQEWGMAKLHHMMQLIDKADPGAPDPVKWIALGQVNKLLAPEERLQAQMYMKEHQQELSLLMKEMQLAQSQAGLQERIRHDYATEGLAAERAGEGSEKYAQSKMIEYTDKDGNPQQVLVRERKGQAGFIDSVTGQPWRPPEGATGVKEVTAGTAGGGRAGAQIGRQITAGAEVMVDLQNVRDMPVGTTTGLFGSVTPGVTLSGALKGDLARHLTREDEINMKQAMSGIGRELSTLMSPVYGGNWASEQLEPLIPKDGYTVNNALYGIARIKQSAVNAIDSLEVSPIVGSEQKKYAKKLRQQIEDAIPWDVKDVVAFQSGANPKQTFGEYSKQKGVEGAASRKSSGGIQGATIDDLEKMLQGGNLSTEQLGQIQDRLNALGVK